MFCNINRLPLLHRNITKREWHPLLIKLKLEPSKPQSEKTMNSDQGSQYIYYEWQSFLAEYLLEGRIN